MGGTKANFIGFCGLKSTQVCISPGEWDINANGVKVRGISGLDHILIVGERDVADTLSDNDLLKAFKERRTDGKSRTPFSQSNF
jgi:hypothetical protein